GNAARLGLAIECIAGSWWQPLAERRFDLVLSNPPYVAEGDPHLDVLRHEPQRALTSGTDGLEAIRQIVSGAPGHLRAGGWLLVEHGFDQAASVRALLAAAGLLFVESRRDLSGHERVSGGRLCDGAV
ncbi:MAG: peptide chain release factor N(5)-glutamine methyltransferase, partial [Caldimonas sp.]